MWPYDLALPTLQSMSQRSFTIFKLLSLQYFAKRENSTRTFLLSKLFVWTLNFIYYQSSQRKLEKYSSNRTFKRGPKLSLQSRCMCGGKFGLAEQLCSRYANLVTISQKRSSVVSCSVLENALYPTILKGPGGKWYMIRNKCSSCKGNTSERL